MKTIKKEVSFFFFNFYITVKEILFGYKNLVSNIF